MLHLIVSLDDIEAVGEKPASQAGAHQWQQDVDRDAHDTQGIPEPDSDSHDEAHDEHTDHHKHKKAVRVRPGHGPKLEEDTLMVMSLQEISDRMEIQELMVSYSHAVDSRDWDALDDVFTDDAIIDYTEMGGSRGDVVETKAFLKKAMPNFAGFQHMVATSKVILNGDTADGRTICHNPMLLDKGNGEVHVFFCGLWYRDHFVRTPSGWRIQSRYEEKSYFHNLPEDFKTPA